MAAAQTRFALWPCPPARGESERKANACAHPPRCDDAPRKSDQRKAIGVNDLRMEDREVFRANADRDLIVHEPVHNGSSDASEEDFEELHRLRLRYFEIRHNRIRIVREANAVDAVGRLELASSDEVSLRVGRDHRSVGSSRRRNRPSPTAQCPASPAH